MSFRNGMLIVDLDDTLIDTQIRQYEVFCFVVKNHLALTPQHDKETYYTIRREKGFSNISFLKTYYNINEDSQTHFRDKWLELIEDKKFLSLDRPILKNADALTGFSKKNSLSLILLSLRSFPERGLEQLRSLGMESWFDQVFFLQHHPVNPKIETVRKLKEKSSNIVGLIGDSSIDKEAAELNGIPFYKVNTGIYNFVSKNEFDTINDLIENFSHGR